MTRYEFKVVPAPRRGEKSRAVRSVPDRFALAVSTLMNELGRDGWDYVRADTLPCDERVGLTGTRTTYQHLLVFRRPMAEERLADARHRPTLTVEPPLAPSVPPLDWPPAGGGTAPAIGPASGGRPVAD